MEKTKEKERKENEKSTENLDAKNNNPTSQNNQSKNKAQKIQYLNQKVSLPVKLSDRIEYINNFFENEEIGYIAKYAPQAENSNTRDMAKYFKSKLKNIFEIASGILFYFFKTFNLDFQQNNNSTEIRTPDQILKSKIFKNVDEICILYQDICQYCGVKISIISGFLKKQGYKIGDSLIKHKWCFLICPGEKKFLIDPYLVIYKNSPKEKENEDAPEPEKIKPFYFLTPPEFFIENHIPDDEKNQCLIKTIKIREFTKKAQTNTENFYNSVFKYKIKLENYMYPEFQCNDSEIVIKFSIDNMDLSVECICNGKKLSSDKVSITNNNSRNKYETKVIFPNNGDYKLIILGKPIGTVINQFPIIFYKINVKITNIIKHEDPKKKIANNKILNLVRAGSPQYQKKRVESTLQRQLTKCSSDLNKKIKNKCFDNEDCHLYEPTNKILKIGQETKFKVKIKNAKNVAVLDGKKWKYLKRKENDLFEGAIIIENENVVLCAMRNKNMFTEVFEFMAIKR